MTVLNFVLCLSLLCGLCVAGIPATTEPLPLPPSGFGGFGGFSPLSEKALADLHPNVTESFKQLGKKHDDFDLIAKRILSGKSQVVAGTRYVLTVEATNLKGEVKTCEADIWEKTWENFFLVKLKCQEKDYEIRINFEDRVN
ncbi:uncharacterized protein LOC129573320 [Sitodiplosis mosellana]|uniref:uncharacterized protein LOC129573320 n=1 Tax=Sitodiplosis mosellana TaxID=263140 RepID=UPI002443D0CA|nr:uncharacterized protein LOC129573320 [Sitodiplosis mosellana]